ncbi:MAG: SEC-C domain-containing protein [Actinobacteria bacterium]|nr:SEC-C domain-containing protein [Actinomycetota bacterium]
MSLGCVSIRPPVSKEHAVAKIGRNQPCPCGSGAKAKRCCGVPRGPSPDQLATAFLNAACRQWAPVLAGYTVEELGELFQEVAALPATDLSLHARLPRLLPAGLQRLRTAIAEDDADAVTAAMPDALAIIDTPLERQRLARAVLALHDDGHRIDCDTAAAAIIDLAADDHSLLLLRAMIEALSVDTGTARTPAGLLVAAR